MGKNSDPAAALALPRADLLQLQSRMKQDPAGYEAELQLQLRHFRACLNVLALQGPIASEASPGVKTAPIATDYAAAKEFGDMAMFLAHVTPSYPQFLAEFPKELLALLSKLAAVLPASLRRQLAQAVILLRNREKVDTQDSLPVMLKLMNVGDKALKKLVFSHVVHNIGQMNRKHRNETKNRALQNIVCTFLQEDSEASAKHALVLLCDLYRRKIWIDERSANAICNACFHRSSRIMISVLKFLHGYDSKMYEEESDDSDIDDEMNSGKPAESVMLNREAVYKANHKGTSSSRKKKQAKLERVMRSLKKKQRLESLGEGRGSFAPLQQLHDPQGFAEKLYARLKTCTERFQVKLMMIMALSRCIGMHQLVLLDFYSYLQRYVSPHQQEETQVLAAVVQACHAKVPVDTVESLLKQLVNSFIHDRSRPEVIAVGLNVVREMCARMPLIMNKDLLEDLSMYRKSREKPVSAAANSIISLFRQVNPSLLRKKDRGRGADLTVQPKEFGEASFHTNVPGIDLLDAQDHSDEDSDADDDLQEPDEVNSDEDNANEAEGEEEDEDMGSELEEFEDSENEEDEGEEEDEQEEEEKEEDDEQQVEEELQADKSPHKRRNDETDESPRKRQKLETDAMELKDMSLSQLKMLAGAKTDDPSIDVHDGVLSNEDFKRIRQLQAEKLAKDALGKEGNKLKLRNADSLSERPVNPANLEANIRRRQNKEERVASSKAGREDREAFGARTAMKHKKTGGLSNRQKEKKKAMPVAAQRMKAARSREERKSLKRRSANQFRGKKAWKC